MSDGLTHVWGRRITGLNLSMVPQDLNLPGNGNADSPDIDIENDGSYAWIVFRQDIGGVSRTLGRRLRGSQYEAPEFIDAGVPSTDPKVDMNGVGQGYAVAQTPGGAQVFGSWLDHDHLQPGLRLDTVDGTGAAKPEVASTDQADSVVAWRLTGADGNSVARARYHDGEDAAGAMGGELTLSRGDLGPVADPGVVHQRRPIRRRRGRHGPGRARRAHAGGRDLRPPAGRAVHRRDRGLQAQDAPRAALAAGHRSVGRADVPDLHGRRPDRPDDGEPR